MSWLGYAEGTLWRRDLKGVGAVTITGYVVTMTRVGIADFKARLSEYLRGVRRGRSITVLDRDTPVVRVVPYVEQELRRVREPRGRVATLQKVPLPPPLPIDMDAVELLLEERQVER